MDNNIVQLYIPKRLSKVHVIPQPRACYPPGWRGWLCRFGYWLAKKNKIALYDMTDEYHWSQITEHDLLDSLRIWRISIAELMELETAYLLVGRDAQEKLFDICADQPFVAQAPNLTISRGYGAPTQCYGLQLLCIPWINGMIPIPDPKTLKPPW